MNTALLAIVIVLLAVALGLWVHPLCFLLLVLLLVLFL